MLLYELEHKSQATMKIQYTLYALLQAKSRGQKDTSSVNE